MKYQELLASLKVDLGITTTAYDQRLTAYLQRANEEIEREGVTLLPSSLSDQNLVINYAAWMWRKRDTGEGIPRMIRWQINNRLFGKAQEEESE